MEVDRIKGIPVRTYGRRHAKKLKGSRASAMEDVLPQVKISLPEGDDFIDPKSFFNFPVKEIWFEIGFGGGEHLLHQAVNNPDVGFIGCEPFINGVSSLCVGIRGKNVKNIRVWPDDARMLMDRFAPQSLDRLFLLHPDPWPKNRHHKRRFLQTEILDQLAQLLKPDALFRMATDHQELAVWLLKKMYFHSTFEWCAASADDWRKPPPDCPETRYGQKGLEQGRPPVYFSFRRI